ncbi:MULTISPECIES: hydrogenase maturation protease [Haloarcula]|uniref:hydrogenase maturation protease n=1 Tax=Haloarcula TaxID=2237 RepID=UPI0023EB5051|nr:hydrogenase maturation protease [Halomicroarcula sp. XH51]
MTGAHDAVAIVGVGNPTMGDDGLGRAVLDRLVADADVVGAGGGQDGPVRAAFAGTTGFFALEAMDGVDRAVVVDAVDADGPPGTVHRVRLDRPRAGSGAAGGDPALTGGVPEVTLHDITFRDALRTCRSAYDLPDWVVLVGVVPAVVEGGIGLSDPVTAAVPTAAAAVRAELDRRPRHGTDGGDPSMDTTWYCHDCDRRIDSAAVDEHEARGHSVRGRLRPDRLLAQDPWETDGTLDEDGESGPDDASEVTE